MAELTLARLPLGTRDLLRAIVDIARDRAPVLVGGLVRDVELGRPLDSAHADIDVAVASDALGLARRVADRVGGSFVALDETRGAARVIVAGTRLDLTDLRAPTLAADLAARDFTVNALAVPLTPLVTRGRAAIVDPTGGLADLAARRLRPPDARVLSDDPLRALRGVRLEAELGLRLTPATVRAIRAVAPLLPRVSAERIRDEILVMLALPRTEHALRRLDHVRLLGVVFPEIEAMRATAQPAPHRFTVLEHSLRAVGGADRLLAHLGALEPFADELVTHVREPIGGGIERRQMLKLAALLHDVSKPETRRLVDGRIRFFEHDTIGAARARAIGERLKLPERATALVERLVRHHLRTMHLGQAESLTARARYRFFRDLREDTRDLLLLTLVDAAAVTGASPLATWRRATLVRDLLRGWLEDRAVGAAPSLVRGEDIMRRFHLAPGPRIGELLRRAREAQDLGLVGTKEDALLYLDSLAVDSLE
jgi:putative nucleotidyltransferase with HDIG domain